MAKTPISLSNNKVRRTGRRITIYGEPGAGKTTLLVHCAGKCAFFDLEGTLYSLFGDDVPSNIIPFYADSHDELVAKLKECDLSQFDSIGIDSLTQYDNYMNDYVLWHFTPNKGGYGRVDFNPEKNAVPLKSLNQLQSGGDATAKSATYAELKAELNRWCIRGLDIIQVCHDSTKERTDVVDGALIQHEPAIMDAKNNSIRSEVVRDADELYYIKRELAQDESGLLSPTGRRVVYFDKCGGILAKTRSRGLFIAANRDHYERNENGEWVRKSDCAEPDRAWMYVEDFERMLSRMLSKTHQKSDSGKEA